MHETEGTKARAKQSARGPMYSCRECVEASIERQAGSQDIQATPLPRSKPST